MSDSSKSLLLVRDLSAGHVSHCRPPGASDDDEGRSGKRKSPTRIGLACRIELFLLLLTAVEKVSGLLVHWVS
ncbi:hypothetical protein [Amycolatopsis kentuckyensis]|uniref:hypothetical protein n=1 Tax=Amycolatopsis kentuckyensis TaxID=218823 RepID=UPI00117763F1|nr:hypothetical protein [Amycolatopsis kentuckyensis]